MCGRCIVHVYDVVHGEGVMVCHSLYCKSHLSYIPSVLCFPSQRTHMLIERHSCVYTYAFTDSVLTTTLGCGVCPIC